MTDSEDTETQSDDSENTEVPPPRKACAKCGADVGGGGKFCAECGTPIEAVIDDAVDDEPVIPVDMTDKVDSAAQPEDPTPTKRRQAILVAALLLLIAATTAGSFTYKNHQDSVDKRKRAAKTRKVAAVKAAEKRREHKELVATNLACHDMLEPLVTAEHDLSGRLDIGMNYAAYGESVGSVSVAYTALDFDGLGDNTSCLSDIAVPAENAFNQYRGAYNVWNKCMESLSCDNESITGSLQKYWSRAGASTTKAKIALDALEIA